MAASYPALTYELRITASSVLPLEEQVTIKNVLKDWLAGRGIDSYVEGVIDHLDLDDVAPGAAEKLFDELGGDVSPLSLYRYAQDSLTMLAEELHRTFGDKLDITTASFSTESWLEGWKDSFLPFSTRRFFVYPPWQKEAASIARRADPALFPLQIEPGLAFGTGQHATTRLCLEWIEDIVERRQAAGQPMGRCLDVGTGTGILAIGARLMGFPSVLGTDIDEDAVTSARFNAEQNHAAIDFAQGSLPDPSLPRFDLILANILCTPLLKLLPGFVDRLTPGGALVMSGLLVEDRATIAQAARALGAQSEAWRDQDGWIAGAFAFTAHSGRIS